MAGYPVIHPDGVDIFEVDGTVIHYNQDEVVPLSKLISRRYSWLVEREFLSETEQGFGGGGGADLSNVEYIGFNTSAPYHVATEGDLTWNHNDGTLDLGLIGGNVTLQIGQEEVARIKNNTGSPLTPGQVVYINGSIGSGSNYRITVDLAKANAESTSSKTFGMVTESISNGQEGFVTTFGLVRDINTASWNEGDSLYLSPTTAGEVTNVKPTPPNHLVFIGWVVRKNSTAGSIFVHIQNGYELDELHDVKITSKADNDIISYDSTLGYWKNQNLATAVNEISSSLTGIPQSGITNLTSDLALKAPLASPTFTGTPSAPTASSGTNTTQIATTAFVSTAISNLINGAPALLDTLDELAAALGDDANFASTITTALSGKQPLDADLTAIAALAGTSGILKKTATDTWALDTNTYLTSNETITLSGDASGSGKTSITVTISDDSHNHTSSTISALDAGDTTTGTFDIARIPTGTSGTTVALGNHTHAQSDITNLATDLAAKAPIASPTFTGKVTTAASVSGSSGFNIPEGTAPTSPSNGDIWTTSAGMYIRINGSTIGPLGTGGGSSDETIIIDAMDVY